MTQAPDIRRCGARHGRPGAPGRVLIPLTAVLALAGCARVEAPREVLLGPPPAAVLRVLVERATARSTLHALARITVRLPDRSISFDQSVVAAKPGAVRLDVLSPFGTTLFVVASDGATISAFAPQGRRLYRGSATHFLLGPSFPVPLTPAELVDVLFGETPLARGDTTVDEMEVGETLRLALRGREGAREVVWVRREDYALVKREVYRGGAEPAIVVTMEDFSPPGDGAIPQRIRLALPGRKVEVRIRYNDVSLNGTVDAGLFTPPGPRGAKVRSLDRLLREPEEEP